MSHSLALIRPLSNHSSQDGKSLIRIIFKDTTSTTSAPPDVGHQGFKGGTHRRVSERTHFPIQQGGVERAGKKVISYYSKDSTRKMEITENPLGKQCRSEGWLHKLQLSVRAEWGCDSSSHALVICTTPFLRKWNILSKSPRWIFSCGISPALLALAGMH